MKKLIIYVIILIVVILLWLFVVVPGIVEAINFFNLSVPIPILNTIAIVPLAVTSLYTLSLIYSIIKFYFTKTLNKTTNKNFNSNTEYIGYLIGKYWYGIIIVLLLIFIFS